MKFRIFPEHNYKAIFINGKTLRMPVVVGEEITQIKYPEFYDIGINSWCGGECPYCYTNALKSGNHFLNVPEKINQFFGSMTTNQRPFQVALGGSGEPAAHPEFEEILRAFHDLGIVPNYTTNGMHLEESVIKATQKYCGGVALSLHPHLTKFWREAIDVFVEAGVKLNVHVIISSKRTVDFFSKVMEKYGDIIDYYVLLPYRPFGRAKEKSVEQDYLLEVMRGMESLSNVAFGAFFYDMLVDNPDIGASLYPPEIFSRYLIMDDNMKVYNNSFDMVEVPSPLD